jgi:hypothetical protein
MGQQSTSKPLLRAQNKSHQTSDSLVNRHAEITSQSKRQEQGVNATLFVPVLKNISKNAIKQYSQKELKTEDSLVNQEIIQNQLPDQFVEYIAIDTLLKSNEIYKQSRQYDTLNPKPKATKTELVKPDEYTAGFRPKGKGNNWTTVSRKLANISKNNLIVRATSAWDFSIKIGKFSFSRNKYSSKSNLSMK